MARSRGEWIEAINRQADPNISAAGLGQAVKSHENTLLENPRIGKSSGDGLLTKVDSRVELEPHISFGNEIKGGKGK